MVIDGWNSPVTLAMQPVIARANILDITAVSKADPILSGERQPLAIRINSSNAPGRRRHRPLRSVQTLKAKRIGFSTQNDAYGNGAQAAIEQELEQAGQALRGRRDREVPVQADGLPRASSPTSSRPSPTRWSPSTPPSPPGCRP